jgi:hypothetical protein
MQPEEVAEVRERLKPAPQPRPRMRARRVGLPPDLDAALDAVRQDTGRTVPDLIREAIRRTWAGRAKQLQRARPRD